MSPFVILFEDHTAEDFRPVSWSVPAYELRAGIVSLRERLQAILGADGRDLGLLPRALLEPLQAATAPPGAVVGAAACRERASGGGLLCLSARIGPDWELLERLLAAGEEESGWAWRDEAGLLACRLPAREAAAWLDAWVAWNAATADAGCWTHGADRAERFLPAPPRRVGAAPDGVAKLTGTPGAALGHVWDVVPALGKAIVDDCARLVAGGMALRRRPFGVVPDPEAWPLGAPWEGDSVFTRGQAAGRGAGGELWTAQDVRLDPSAVIDTGAGPVILDRGVHVQPFCYLQGPLYIGAGTLVKAGARVYGETSLGAVCRVAGELGESLLLDFVNKQHDGFIGHAVIAGWTNLGAGTTCSDLKNTYGLLSADYGLGPVETGLRFLGVMMGEHAKTAIGTLLNTATVVGFASNVFGAGFPPKLLPNFTWGDPAGAPYDAQRAAAVASRVMNRRGCRFLSQHEALFRALARES